MSCLILSLYAIIPPEKYFELPAFDVNSEAIIPEEQLSATDNVKSLLINLSCTS